MNKNIKTKNNNHKPKNLEGNNMTMNNSVISPMPNQEIVIHTDGGCTPNPGKGAWAFVLQVFIKGKLKLQINRAEHLPKTTNNIAELTAFIEALEICPIGTPITLITDSQYLQKGCTEWLEGWKAKGMCKKGNKPIENKELWIKIDGIIQEKSVDVLWIRGHSGVELNELADDLTTSAKEGFSTNETTSFDTDKVGSMARTKA